MKKEDLQILKKQLSNLSKEEQKERDLYLRGLASGEIEGPPVGYPSIDKPWLAWYKKENLNLEREDTNAFDYFVKVAPSDITLLEYYGKKYSKADIIKEVNEYKNRFIKMGIHEGSTVSFIMLNVPEVLFSWLALASLGATANFIKFDESPERIKLMNNIGNSDYLFATEIPFIIENVKKSIELGNNVKEVITIPITEEMPKTSLIAMLYEQARKNAKNGNVELLKELLNNLSQTLKEQKQLKKEVSESAFTSFEKWKKTYSPKNAVENSKGKGSNVSVVVYTGGTTGSPKGVELTNNNIIAMAHDFYYSEFGFEKGKSSLNILPPGPAYYLNATYALMCCGVRVDLISNFTVEDYPKLIAKHKPNIFLSGPILLKAIVDSDIIDDCSFMTEPISGGDKLHLSEEKNFNDYVKRNNGNAVVHQGYGESESTAAATYMKDEAAQLGTIGIPMIDVEVSTFDFPYENNDVERKYNEIGEICITGPTIMKGYRNNPVETDKVLKLHSDGKYWLHTEDLGYMDDKGRLFHCGRAKRMLTRAGAKVWLGTLEDTIKSHPNVDNCCCVKLSDELEREVPVAHVVLINDDNQTFEELDRIILESQPESYVPKYYVKCDEIPVTTVNKKVDFKQLESLDILDEDSYDIKGKIISKKTKVLKKENNH